MMISLYINHKINQKRSHKVNPTYEESLNYEVRQLKENNMSVHMEGFQSPWLKIGTQFGPLDLYKHGNSTDEIVIFVHGIMCNNRTAIKTLDYYLDRKKTVISYDNFGWGQMAKSGKCTYGIKEAKLLKEIIEIIRKEYPQAKIHLHGESMGGGTIYKFINDYGQDQIYSFFIDAGYYNFMANVMSLANKQLPIISYSAIPLLKVLLYFEGMPMGKMVSTNKINNVKNITHVHSRNDSEVSFKTMLPIKEIINFYDYKDANVRHVRGYYDAKQELYQVLDLHYKNAV